MEAAPMTAGKRGVTVKALKRVLKKAGMKTTGKKATLTRRAKKAHLLNGGEVKEILEGTRTAVKGVGEMAKGVVGAPFAATEAVLGKGRRRY